MIATALLEESLALRQAGIDLPLLVLGPMDDAAITAAVETRISPGIPGPEGLAAACRVAKERDVHVQLTLDSGMGRMGVTESELAGVAAMIRGTPRLKIDALYTHFANADDADDPFTEAQIAQFDRMIAALRAAGVEAPLHHLANSAATLRHLVRPGDFVRCGIALFGPGTSGGIAAGSAINADRRAARAPGSLAALGMRRPVMRWRTEIVRLKELPAGRAIGYGTTFHTTPPSRIAILPVGYADGYSRLLSNRGDVLLRGRRVPVVGRVSMDLVTIDVTDVPEAAPR